MIFHIIFEPPGAGCRISEINILAGTIASQGKKKKKVTAFLIDSFYVPPTKACVSLLWSFPGSGVLQLIVIYITSASLSQGQWKLWLRRKSSDPFHHLGAGPETKKHNISLGFSLISEAHCNRQHNLLPSFCLLTSGLYFKSSLSS